ncbi:unnamed protein product [Closterium sp. NIES-53]
MIALCQEHILEHRTKYIALRYFLARELQQRGQLCLAYVATRANTADIITKALASACFAFLDWSCDNLFSPTLPMGLLIPDFCQQQQQQQQYCLEQLESGCCYQNRFNSQVCVRKSRREQGRAASTCSASLLQHVGSCGSNSWINVRSSASGSTSTLSGTTGGPASSTLGYIIGITDPIGLKRKRGEAAAGAAAAEGATETQDASHEIGSTAVAASAAAAAAAAAASSAPFDLQSGGGGGCGSCGGSGGSGGGGGGGEAGGEAKREGDAEGDAGGLGVGGFDVGAESRKYPPVPLVASPPRELFRKASEDLPPTAGPWRSAAESLARAQPGGRNREDREAQKVPAHNPREFTATVTAAASAGGGGGSAGPVSSLSPRAPSLAPGDTAPLPSFAPAQYPFPHAHFPPYSFRPPSSASRASALARRSSRGGRLGGGGGVLRGKGVVGGWGSESSDDMTAAAAAASAASPVATGAGGNGGGASAGMGAGGGGERIGGGGGARAGASVGVGGSADGHNGVFVNRGLATWVHTRQQWRTGGGAGGRAQLEQRQRGVVPGGERGEGAGGGRADDLGDSGAEQEGRASAKNAISPGTTYEQLLSTNRPFPKPVPLPEMVEFLVGVWDQEGLYD